MGTPLRELAVAAEIDSMSDYQRQSYGIALVASLTTLASVLSAHLATSLLWIEQGQIGMPHVKPALFGLGGILPALLVGILFHQIWEHRSTRAGTFLAFAGGLALAASLAGLSIVSAQAVIDMRAELVRGTYLVALFSAQTLLMIAPACGVATISWSLMQRDEPHIHANSHVSKPVSSSL